jgi:hypothetical protein
MYDENPRCVHARCHNIDKTWETLLFCLATTKIHAWEVCSSISPLGERQKSTGEKIRQRVWMNIILAVWEFRFWKEHCSWWECGLTGSGEVLGQCENGNIVQWRSILKLGCWWEHCKLHRRSSKDGGSLGIGFIPISSSCSCGTQKFSCLFLGQMRYPNPVQRSQQAPVSIC